MTNKELIDACEKITLEECDVTCPYIDYCDAFERQYGCFPLKEEVEKTCPEVYTENVSVSKEG